MLNPTENNQQETEILNPDELCPRHIRMNSFVDRYGGDELVTSTTGQIKNYFKKQCASITCLSFINGIFNRIPLIRSLINYNVRADLFGDIIAGITVAIMHVPQGMAYGVLTTLPAVHGLYVSFFPVIVYMIFGTCPHLSVGTFAVISIMTAQAIENVVPPGTVVNGTDLESMEAALLDQKIQAGTTLALLVGLVQIILSFLRLGFLTVYLTEPFISGFTCGAAMHVFTSQIPSLFGVKSPSGISGAFKLPKFYWKLFKILFQHVNWVSTIIGGSSVVILYLLKDLNDRFKEKLPVVLPSELIIVTLATTVSHFARIPLKYGVAVVGDIKRGLPYPTLPSISSVDQLLVPAITIAAVSLSISISLAKMFSRKHGYKVSSNQELLAYGMSNAVSSFFQCYPNAGSLSRSVVQEGSGGKTILIGGFSSVLLGAVIVALTPLFRSLPMTCLAAIIIVNLKGLFLQTRDFIFYYRISLLEFVLWTITFVTVILFDVDVGLYVGISTSFIINTIRTQKPRFVTLGQIETTGIFKNVALFSSAIEYPKIKILRFDESLYACNAPFFKRKFYELIGFRMNETNLFPCQKKKPTEIENKSDLKFVILDCSPFNYIDTVGVKLLIEIFQKLKKNGIVLKLTECRCEVRRTFMAMQFEKKTDPHILFVTTNDAVQEAISQIRSDSKINEKRKSIAENSV